MSKQKIEYATVDDVIEILKKQSRLGKGDYTVVCNNEYALALPNEKPEINEKRKHISLGGCI